MGAFETIWIEQGGTVAVAVSGGGDSVALLARAREAFGPRGVRLVALTVDHGLRPESRAEAEAVAAWCAARGISHRILEWHGPKPKNGHQEAARGARYELLTKAARDADAGIVLTGHTHDDQLETVWMRRARGDGPGLAGIAPATLAFDPAGRGCDVWFVRPLLGEARAGLRAWLKKQRIRWHDDPTNADMRHERVRARRAIAAMDAAEREELAETQRLAAQLRHDHARKAAACIDAHWRTAAPGLYRTDAEHFAQRISGSQAALRHVLALAGGTGLPDAVRVAQLAARLAKEERFRATLARCVVDKRGSGIFIFREARGIEQRSGTFDNRFRWIATELQGGEARTPTNCDRPESLIAAATRTLPPDRNGGAWRPILNPWPDLLPDFDLVIACAIARLARTSEPARPPLRER